MRLGCRFCVTNTTKSWTHVHTGQKWKWTTWTIGFVASNLFFLKVKLVWQSTPRCLHRFMYKECILFRPDHKGHHDTGVVVEGLHEGSDTCASRQPFVDQEVFNAGDCLAWKGRWIVEEQLRILGEWHFDQNLGVDSCWWFSGRFLGSIRNLHKQKRNAREFEHLWKHPIDSPVNHPGNFLPRGNILFSARTSAAKTSPKRWLTTLISSWISASCFSSAVLGSTETRCGCAGKHPAFILQILVASRKQKTTMPKMSMWEDKITQNLFYIVLTSKVTNFWLSKENLKVWKKGFSQFFFCIRLIIEGVARKEELNKETQISIKAIWKHRPNSNIM